MTCRLCDPDPWLASHVFHDEYSVLVDVNGRIYETAMRAAPGDPGWVRVLTEPAAMCSCGELSSQILVGDIRVVRRSSIRA